MPVECSVRRLEVRNSGVLAAVAHALAAEYGVTGHLLAEAHRLDRSPLTEPDYLRSVAARAWRWAPEFHEIAAALTATNLPPDLALAAANVTKLWAEDKDDWVILLEAVLARLTGGADSQAASG